MIFLLLGVGAGLGAVVLLVFTLGGVLLAVLCRRVKGAVNSNKHGCSKNVINLIKWLVSHRNA